MGDREGMRQTRLEAQSHVVSSDTATQTHNGEYMERISGRAVFECVEEPGPMRPCRQKGWEFNIRGRQAFQTETTARTKTSTGAQDTQAPFQMVVSTNAQASLRLGCVCCPVCVLSRSGQRGFD